jgi:hypothetical protein
MGPPDPCVADPKVQLFAVPLAAEKLEHGHPLELAGSWAFPYGPSQDGSGALLLRGGPASNGHARVDITNPARPALLGYSDRAPAW